MEEEFYATIKLVSGEEILSIVNIDHNYEEPIITLHSPVIMKVMNGGHGSFIKVRPWMELASEDFFIIKHDKIVTMSETHDPKIIEIYKRFLQDDDDADTLNFTKSGRVRISGDMGYINSVDEAREVFENLYNESKPNKES